MRIYLVAGLALMAASPAVAQSQYTQQVNNQLDRMESNARGQGQSRLFRSPIFQLNEGATQVYPVSLVRGGSYTIGGVCDNDCPDLDIKLIDPNGNEVASDVLTDSAPIVNHSAAMSGTYRVRVVMYDCNVNPCSAGLTVMGSNVGRNIAPTVGRYDQQVNNQLDAVERGSAGATRLFRSPIFRLAEGASQDYNVTLIAGVPYKIAGVCDNDCPDLDIKLFDNSGNELASDSLTDSVPIVTYRPGQSGSYRVRVVMYDCNISPCSAGVTVMATGAAATGANVASSGRDQYEQQVNNQLDTVERNASGMSRLFRSPIFRLNEGATQDYPITIGAGQRYTIGGVCDNDCPDLDIKLLDASGTEVASDTATDSAPIVSYSANKSGAFTVRVVMYDCNIAPCAAGLTVMASGMGSANIAPTPNASTSQYDQQVNNQLDNAERAASGMNRLFRSPIFRLNESATQDYPIAMQSGQRYTIAGVCDNDCPDLDIKLIDPTGTEVAEDTATDSAPVVSHVPTKSGTYTVRVVMYDCNVGPCAAGLTIMGTGGVVPNTSVNRPAPMAGQYDAQVNIQLDNFERGQSSAVRLFRSPIFRLNEGADRDFVVTLIAGVNYKIAGVCDNDCPDMDIKLMDQEGNTLANDALTDSSPIVTFRPTRGGPYKVRMVMFDCNNAPCSAGVTVMATN